MGGYREPVCCRLQLLGLPVPSLASLGQRELSLPVPVRLFITKSRHLSTLDEGNFTKTHRHRSHFSSRCRQNAALALRELGWFFERFFSNLLLCTLYECTQDGRQKVDHQSHKKL